MFSIYTSAFNVIANQYDYQGALQNFSEFATEVIIAVNKSHDDSLDKIREFAKTLEPNLTQSGRMLFVKIVPTEFRYDDPDLDGKIKNAALQATTRPFKIGLDLDERIPLSNKAAWIRCAKTLELYPAIPAAMITSVNLYKDERHCKDIGTKWYLHKGGMFRGVVNFARNPNGTHDINKSDSCELIDAEGNLTKAIAVTPLADVSLERKLEMIRVEKFPYVLHYGYTDLKRRAELNQVFWKKHWELEAGRPVDIPLTEEELSNFSSVEHNLPLC